MRVAIIGQRAFGEAVFDAFVAAGHQIVAVFAPSPGGDARLDALHNRASQHGIKVCDLAACGRAEARTFLEQSAPDLAVMAYVTTFLPENFCKLPKHGTIQFHPSLLPRHRGPSAVNWAIIQGQQQTGITIFRPSEGLDQGSILLRKSVSIGPDDTAGSLYYEKLLPLGVAALLEAAESVSTGRTDEIVQNETDATYEGWVKDPESRIPWEMHVDQVYNLIRGCNPRPGAWTVVGGRRVRILDAKKLVAHTFGEIRGGIAGVVTGKTPQSFRVCCPGGHIEVLGCRLDDGTRVSGGMMPVEVGMKLGAEPLRT